MLRRLYDWLMDLAARPYALTALAVVSFVESSFFPVPPDAMILPMVLAKPERAWRIALVATIASVLGGMLGYAIGYYLLETIGQWLINFYGYQQKLQEYRDLYAEWGLWIILVKGLTPIPYKLVTIASGAAAFNFWIFVAASLLTRGVRFFLIAAVLRRWGEPVRVFVERRLTLVTTGFVLIVVAGFAIVKYAI